MWFCCLFRGSNCVYTSHTHNNTHTWSHSHVGCRETFALHHGAGFGLANPVARQSKPITVWGQIVNLYNIHFPASFTALASHPRSRVMHQGAVSLVTQFELAQFIKLGPVHKPEFTRRGHLQQTAAAHSWWEGQADVQGKSKREKGESLRASVCQPQWEPLHPLLKDRVQLAELTVPSCLGLARFSHSKTLQHADRISCALMALCLNNNNHFGTSRGGQAEGLKGSVYLITLL